MVEEELACEEPLCLEAPSSPARAEDAKAHSRGLRISAGLAVVLLGAAALAVAFLTGGRAYPSEAAQSGPVPAHASEYLSRVSVEPKADDHPPLTFYVYRAGGEASYPLDNVNVADLAGVMWYLHNEVIVSTPRKYAIDRIRRYKLKVKTTQEFWNVHHRNFGAFLAFDAARCTTPICGSIFSQYGFIVGCQVLPIDVAPYLGEYQTQVNGACSGRDCNAPVWYSLPGSCPTEGLSNQQISGNAGAQDVNKAKSARCLKEQPGGRCRAVSGAPDCTFHTEPAGEIMLNELAGIDNYDHFWNTSFAECEHDVKAGLRKGPCYHNKEFDLDKDHGTGCSFWDGKADKKAATKRMKAVRDLFKKHYPDMPYDLKQPPCDFDMYYDGESDWPINHTGAAKPSRGFSWEKAMEMRKTTTTPRPAGAGPEPTTCKEIGCGKRGTRCDCNPSCKKYHDCCSDYKDLCRASDAEVKDDADEEEADDSNGLGAEVKHGGSSHKPKLSKACMEAEEECSKAVDWAKGSGYYEHPDWYKGLTGKSGKDEFRKLLAKTKHGSCHKVCTGDHGMVFLKK